MLRTRPVQIVDGNDFDATKSFLGRMEAKIDWWETHFPGMMGGKANELPEKLLI